MTDGGFPLVSLGQAKFLAHTPVLWSEIIGVQPWMARFIISTDEAAKLTLGGEYTLTIDDGVDPLRVNGLFYLGAAPSDHPDRVGILVADRRVWWRRKHVMRRYNVRTRSGNRRRLDADGLIAEEVAPTVDDVTFKVYSLKGGTERWTAEDILKDVMDEVEGEGKWSGSTASFAERDIDTMELDLRADTAIATVLANIPGLQIVVGRDGKVRIYNRFSLTLAQQEMDKIRPRRIPDASEEPKWVNLTHSRPETVHVLFNVEQEIRFDSLLPGDTITKDQRYLQNVIQIPDPTLVHRNETLVEGTWLTMEEIFHAWNNDKGSGGANLTDISHDVVQDLWFTSYLEGYYGGLGKPVPDVVWLKRIAAVRRFYRTTYRISRRWMARVHSVRPYRVSLLDFETGQFARSAVYCDWAALFTERGILANADSQYVGFTVDGSVEPGQPLSEAESAPAIVHIMDEEQGIFQLQYFSDLLGHLHQIIPSGVPELPTIQSIDWRTRGYFQDGTANADGGTAINLAETHRISTVLTVAPGSPNSTHQFYAVPVTLAEARTMMPSGANAYDAFGPTWSLRVSPQMATARFAWSHGAIEEIERSMGIGADEGSDRTALKDLLQNPAALDSLAKATAAALYMTMLDHWEGNVVAAWTPGVEVNGNIQSVTHSVGPDGVMTTAAVFAGEFPPIDPMSLLPMSARIILNRLVQQ